MAKQKRKRKCSSIQRIRKVLLFCIIFSLIIGYLWFSNNIIFVSKQEYKATIPDSFNGYRIVQLSDTHIGKNDFLYNDMIKKVSELCPDVIVITGDFIDKSKFNEETALSVASSLCNIAKVYFVTGNHESALSTEQPEFLSKLELKGFTILDNTSEYLYKNNERIAIAGVHDDGMIAEEDHEKLRLECIAKSTENIPDDVFTIYLAHRPEHIESYVRKNTLVLCGHAHGGQVRIPFWRGVYAPGQGLFPKYSSGMYKVNGCDMYVSRGIGNSRAIQRLFNQPEIVLITLTK